MLVNFNNIVCFATKLKTIGWELQAITIEYNKSFKIKLDPQITFVNNIGTRVETHIVEEYTQDDLIKFTINYGGYISTEYNTIIKDERRTEEPEYKIAIDKSLWKTSMDLNDVWTSEYDIAYEEGWLQHDHPEYIDISKMAYTAGYIKHQIGEIETEIRRSGRHMWKRWNIRNK